MGLTAAAASLCMVPTASHIAASHPATAAPTAAASSSTTTILLGQHLLLDLDLLPLLLCFSILVDLLDGFGALIPSARHPLTLHTGR